MQDRERSLLANFASWTLRTLPAGLDLEVDVVEASKPAKIGRSPGWIGLLGRLLHVSMLQAIATQVEKQKHTAKD